MHFGSAEYYMEITDEILIAGIKKNDYTSYNQLFVRYYSRLCTFVFRIVQNETASEDVVQELFIRLWIQREKLDIKDSISGYLYRASKNAALNFLRSEHNRLKNLQNIPASEWITDESYIEQVELTAVLHQCIGQLPARSREVFLLSRFDGLKQKEIAGKLDISVKTIKNQIWKSLLYLKSCLELKSAFKELSD